jgi:putative restriction endonuclease
MTETKKLWILKSKGEDSAFGANDGYADNPVSHYAYDTTVRIMIRLVQVIWL